MNALHLLLYQFHKSPTIVVTACWWIFDTWGVRVLEVCTCYAMDLHCTTWQWMTFVCIPLLIKIPKKHYIHYPQNCCRKLLLGLPRLCCVDPRILFDNENYRWPGLRQCVFVSHQGMTTCITTNKLKPKLFLILLFCYFYFLRGINRLHVKEHMYTLICTIWATLTQRLVWGGTVLVQQGLKWYKSMCNLWKHRWFVLFGVYLWIPERLKSSIQAHKLPYVDRI